VTAVKRILLTSDSVGGVWQYSLDLARGLATQGIETILAVMGPSPSTAQCKAAEAIPGLVLVDTGLPLDWLAPDAASVASAGHAIAALADRRQADLVQLHAASLAAEARFSVPVLAVAHSCVATWWQAVKGGPVDPPYRWRAELNGAGLRQSDLVVAPSHAFSRATQQVYALGRAPSVVHNGRSPLPLPQVAPHDFAFTAGRLWDKGKNVATLDRAAARLAIPVYAAGPTTGANGDSVQLEHCRGLGSLDEDALARWLAARPVFASVALYEPFGLAVLEAAAAGCPLVLSDIPTFRELWQDAATFVDPMDDRGLADAISGIAGDGTLHAQLGAKAKARAARYTPERMASAMAALYDELVPARAPLTEAAA
jgi:glycosyltransferase involved in cell wall biosynthesis